MIFSKISKFFAAGLLLSSLCVANASEVNKAESKEAVVEAKADTPKVDTNVETKSKETSKEENKDAGSTNGTVKLGSVSVKSSESCSETSFIVEQNADGSYVVRDADSPASDNSDVVSRTKVYERSCCQVYNIFYDPSEGLVCQPVDSSKTAETSAASETSSNEGGAAKTADQNA